MQMCVCDHCLQTQALRIAVLYFKQYTPQVLYVSTMPSSTNSSRGSPVSDHTALHSCGDCSSLLSSPAFRAVASCDQQRAHSLDAGLLHSVCISNERALGGPSCIQQLDEAREATAISEGALHRCQRPPAVCRASLSKAIQGRQRLSLDGNIRRLHRMAVQCWCYVGVGGNMPLSARCTLAFEFVQEVHTAAEPSSGVMTSSAQDEEAC